MCIIVVYFLKFFSSLSHTMRAYTAEQERNSDLTLEYIIRIGEEYRTTPFYGCRELELMLWFMGKTFRRIVTVSVVMTKRMRSCKIKCENFIFKNN